jgi:hypothetical protein
MDGTTLTEADMIGVLGKMPFTSEEAEESHSRFVEQI